MYPQKIYIEDELSNLWQNVYDAIIAIVVENGLIGKQILLNGIHTKSLLVERDNTIFITTYDEHCDYAENYEDEVLYDTYTFLCHIA